MDTRLFTAEKQAPRLSLKILGASVMIAGFFGMAWGAVVYFEHRESVLIGEKRVVVEDRNIPLQALAGAGLFIAGAALLTAVAQRKPK